MENDLEYKILNEINNIKMINKKNIILHNKLKNIYDDIYKASFLLECEIEENKKNMANNNKNVNDSIIIFQKICKEIIK
jgi:hypothetical protein